MSTQLQNEIEQFTRGLLQDRLAQCSESQREFFDRIYPDGVSTDKLESAIDLCDRTIKKALKEPAATLQTVLAEALKEQK